MTNGISSAKVFPSSKFVFSLAIAVFGTSMLDVLASLFLVDIAKTFLGSSNNASLAVVSQILTISSIAAVIFGILNGFLSVKFRHKTLLLFGALCIVVGALGCFFAPSLFWMMIFYPFDGIGTIIVIAMAFSMIGETLPLEKRAKSIGLVTSAGIFSSAVGFAWAGFLSSIAGWHSYLLWYVIPISFIALILVYLIVPSRKIETTINRSNYINSFKQVLLNKSAVACLFGNMFIIAAGIWSFFAATFWRRQYGLPVQTVGIITLVVVLLYAVGSITGGRMINRCGRKRLTIASWVGRGLLIGAIVFMPEFWSAFLTSCLATFVGGIAVSSGHSLTLEQAPLNRGTMMSISGVFGSIGASIGVSSGGLALGMFGFQLLGFTLGMFGLISAMIVYFFAKDPCRIK